MEGGSQMAGLLRGVNVRRALRGGLAPMGISPLAAWYVNSVFWPSGNERDADLRRHAGPESEIRVRSGGGHAGGPAWTDLADLAGEAATRQRVDGKGGAHSRPQCLHVIERH